MARDRLPSRLRQVLDETGEPWEIVPGRRHTLIRLGGRLVGTWPRSKGAESLGNRGLENLIAQVRRTVRRR